MTQPQQRQPLRLRFALSAAACLCLCAALSGTQAAIVAPPWSNPSNNPCASQPGGWQLLYWAPLRQCFKIFTKGYPCPDTMELSPVGPSAPRHGEARATQPQQSAECRCPPGTALSDRTGRCHTLFEREPCEGGEYFSPLADLPVKSPIPRKRIGQCRAPGRCTAGQSAFWPADGRCYQLRTRGPCARGKLVRAAAGAAALAECACENAGELAAHFYASEGSCYEHYARGPCEGAGQLFLPGGSCGCSVRMPHYDEATDRCYEIGTIGPCAMGHVFVLPDADSVSATNATSEPTPAVDSSSALALDFAPQRARCQCKEGYVPWSDGHCYRRYTRGPCPDGQFVANASTCVPNPCAKGRLYFPAEQTCYRIGTQGPCTWQQVVVFDFTTRPSLDGISYNGVCGCVGLINGLSNLDQQCATPTNANGVQSKSADGAGGAGDSGTGYVSACAATAGMVEVNGECFKLYSRGPCGPGQWLEPRKLASRMDRRGVHCTCRPNYTKYESDDGLVGCYAPSVSIARYLNGWRRGPYTFGFRRIGSGASSEQPPPTTTTEVSTSTASHAADVL